MQIMQGNLVHLIQSEEDPTHFGRTVCGNLWTTDKPHGSLSGVRPPQAHPLTCLHCLALAP